MSSLCLNKAKYEKITEFLSEQMVDIIVMLFTELCLDVAQDIIVRGCPRRVMVKAMDLQNRSKRVRARVALLRSLSDKYL